MAKSIVLGNGNIHVGLNERGLLSDFYFPYVGLENQVQGDLYHRIGIYMDETYISLDDNTWSREIDLLPDTLVTNITHTHPNNIQIKTNDAVHIDKNIFLRKVEVKNTSGEAKQIKIFFSQVFGLYGNTFQDTAYYDPTENVIVHYEGRRIFLISARSSDIPFDDYSVGQFMTDGKEGTFRDAEDGSLSKNSIEHGQVDSTIGITLLVHPGEAKNIEYSITVGETKQEVYELLSFIKYKGFNKLIGDTADYWSAWIGRENIDFKDLPPGVRGLYQKSMFYIRAHIDNHGAIIDSGDSSILNYGRDTYGYMWPRDGALIVSAILLTGENGVSKRFFKFVNDVQEEAGYLMHKYRPDRSLGSSWHPYINKDVARLPIQEDETALVLISLYEYYLKTRELEFIEQHYADFIHRAASFLAEYIDQTTGLPLQSYDLWEEKYGTSTYTACTVVKALEHSSKIATLLGKDSDANLWQQVANNMRAAIIRYLYLPEEKMFCKLVEFTKNGIAYDKTVDISSVYGVFNYDILPIDDIRIQDSMETINLKLKNKIGVGGMPRYEKDGYFMRIEGTPNPWIICTLWMAQYFIKKSKTLEELKRTSVYFDWVAHHTKSAGAMSEQVHPLTGEQLSATPLCWSHAEYIRTVHIYIDKHKELS